MGSLKIKQIDKPFLYRRFRQIVLITQLSMLVGAMNVCLFGQNIVSSDNLLWLRMDVVVMLGGVALSTTVYHLLNHKKDALAGQVYLWICVLVMCFVTWMEGGLYSAAILTFPLIFVFAALFTDVLVFLSIFVFLSCAVLFMGMNHVFGWYPAPEEAMIRGWARIVAGLVITWLSGYVAWQIGQDLNLSLIELSQENQRVIKSQKLIKQLAESDNLTGLLNRNAAKDCYEIMLSQLKSQGGSIAFYFIDLDNFKDVNDLFDHHAGDQLLITIANRLKELAGSDGVVCRLGGDEFVVFMRKGKDCDFDRFAKRLTDTVSQPHFLLGTKAEVTASIGITIITDDQSSFDDVRKKADMAMYKAKQSGKNKYHYYSEQLNKEYMRNLNIINNLKDALQRNLLDLYFQPKINLVSGKVGGAEALLRWTRGNEDSINPDEFIPIIESTELIHEIGAWVIEEACKACKRWNDEGHHIHVAVNISALQLTRPYFYEVVVGALSRNNLSPKLLEIELTEHLLIQENKEVNTQLEALKSLGVSLAIDDFGTGYSNMNYLTRLKVDVLKLDRSFISQISYSNDYEVVVTAIIQMAKVLGMKVVAEGIETHTERKMLLGLNCDYGQGFLWSEAINTDSFISLLRRGLLYKEHTERVLVDGATIV